VLLLFFFLRIGIWRLPVSPSLADWSRYYDILPILCNLACKCPLDLSSTIFLFLEIAWLVKITISSYKPYTYDMLLNGLLFGAIIVSWFCTDVFFSLRSSHAKIVRKVVFFLIDRLQLTSSPPCWMTIDKRIVISFVVPVIQHGCQGLCHLNLSGMAADHLLCHIKKHSRN